ncbi:hypothetical protein ACFQ48_16635 [Hymenobacter caeli]|uniref:Uncharacterized protein n=1 Tax=Hymenobacter caeli TaxID=2735894 RepID=A0ABX2FVY1_9BACT|nr:hypothetical protein [Hymenobacter caeli]NRT20631.1 hypothetical protein [Hymenobacter caeli]
MKRAAPGHAINMRQYGLDFDLMRSSWMVTDDDLFPNDSSSGKHWYISAVEIAYREKGDGAGIIIRKDSTTLGGILMSVSLQISPRNETISVKQFVFPHP